MAEPVFDQGRRDSVRAQLQTDTPSPFSRALGALTQWWANQRVGQPNAADAPRARDVLSGQPSHKVMRFDTEGRTTPLVDKDQWREGIEGPFSWFNPGGLAMVLGPAGRFTKLTAPRLWAHMERRPELYNVNWKNIDPIGGARGEAWADRIFHTNPRPGSPPWRYTEGYIDLDPWAILGDWNRGPAYTNAAGLGREMASGKGTAGHELFHQWLGANYPRAQLKAPQEMINLFEKQSPGVTGWPMDDPAHNVVHELTRRMIDRFPMDKWANREALYELGQGTTRLELPEWMTQAYQVHNPQSDPTRANILNWLYERAFTPGTPSVLSAPGAP